MVGVSAAVAMLFASLLPYAAAATTIQPPAFDYVVNPGATMKDIIKIYNETPGDISLVPELKNFAAKDESSGTPWLYPPDEKREGGHELAPWMIVDSKIIKIAPKMWGSFEFTVNIPKDAEPGGYFGAVLFREGDGKVGEGVGATGGPASLIMLKVNGETKEGFNITDFKSKSAMYTSLPSELILRTNNTGNVQQKPTGNIYIKNIFGRQVASIPVNPLGGNVLPGTARVFNSIWQKSEPVAGASEFKKELSNFALGPYTASLVLKYGSKGMIATAETSFFVFPWMVCFMYLIIFLLIILLLIIAMKKYNASVIRKYKQGGQK